MAVNIGGGADVCVAHEILGGFQIHALTAQITAVSVPEIVRRDRRIKGVLDNGVAVQLGTGRNVASPVEAVSHAAHFGHG